MPPQTLREALQAQHEAALIRQAETIQRWPIPRERLEQAEVHVRLALWERGLGRISDQTQYRVYSILNFVMPNGECADGGVIPIEELQREADWEAAYFEQLERQSCPECGDGLCPGEDDIRRP
jgi:hypothetical protein